MHCFKLESTRRSHFSREAGGIPHDRPMKSSKLSPQQMTERDEVGGSSGTIPPHCVPIKSLGGTCPGDSELDLGTPQLQYSTAGLLCGITATTGTQCASTGSSLEKLAQLSPSLSIMPSSSTVRTSGTSKRPLAVEPRKTDGHGVSLGPSCGHAAMDQVHLICFLPFLVPRV